MPSSTSGINEQGTSITLQLSSHMSLCAPHMHRPLLLNFLNTESFSRFQMTSQHSPFASSMFIELGSSRSQESSREP